MEYFIYISDAKVDMLYSQIPRNIIAGLTSEIKFDFKIFGVTFSEKERTEEGERYNRLQAVLKYLQKQGEIGSIDEDSPYIQGDLTVQWGIWDGFVFFFGIIANHTIALCGSTSHLLNYVEEADLQKNTSNAGRRLGSSGTILVQTLRVFTNNYDHPGILRDMALSSLDNYGEQRLLRSLRSLHEYDFTKFGFIKQRIKFIAKRLVSGPIKSKNAHQEIMSNESLLADLLEIKKPINISDKVTLGTPLFVSLHQ